MPSKGVGRWEFSVGEHGTCMRRGLESTGYGWKNYNCLAEAEDTFYFVNTGTGRGIECIPVPKWVFKDHGETDAFLDFCRDRGMKWSEMDETGGLLKNDRMLYISIALVLLAVLISSIVRAVCS